jgi:DNA-binding transcriptional ArsR family regulator
VDLRTGRQPFQSRKLRDIFHFVGTTSRRATPSLLPIFRSRQQAELLADVLGDPSREESLTDLASRLGVPLASVQREIERAEKAGLVESRRVGKSRLIRANDASPYYEAMVELLVRSFGVPRVLADALAEVKGIEAAYVFGSWAARWSGEEGARPVGDIDLLVLGDLDRDVLYVKAAEAGRRLGREVQVTIREPGWLESGSDAFHDTVVSRPLVPLDLQSADSTAAQAERA